MYLKEILDNLQYGELRTTRFADAILNSTNPDMDRILSAIRQGLETIYLKFPLKYDTVVLDMASPGTSEVTFNALYSETYNNAFTNNVMYFTEVFSLPVVNNTYKDKEVLTEVPLNILSDPLSVITTSPTSISVPKYYLDNVNYLRLGYRATAPTIPTYAQTFGININNPWIDIDIQFLQPLLAYVTYKLYSSLDAGEKLSVSRFGSVSFDAACRRVEEFGMYHTQERVNGGWD